MVNMPDITPLTRKALVIDFRPPAVPASWNRSDDLIPKYIDAMRKASQDILTFQVVDKLGLPEYPLLMGGRQYTDTTFAGVLADSRSALRDAHGNYPLADYEQILQKFELLGKVESGQIDEVWMFGGPYFGFYESRMVGKGAFWCNGPGIEQDCRRFVIMGFNYERDVKEMVHDYGHRSESVLAKHFGSEKFLRKMYALQPTPVPANTYEQFLLDVGTVHRKPGGADYSQDEFAWLSAMQPEWWPPTIDPNLVGTPGPVSSKSAQSTSVAPSSWYQAILDLLVSLFGKK